MKETRILEYATWKMSMTFVKQEEGVEGAQKNREDGTTHQQVAGALGTLKYDGMMTSTLIKARQRRRRKSRILMSIFFE